MIEKQAVLEYHVIAGASAKSADFEKHGNPPATVLQPLIGCELGGGPRENCR